MYRIKGRAVQRRFDVCKGTGACYIYGHLNQPAEFVAGNDPAEETGSMSKRLAIIVMGCSAILGGFTGHTQAANPHSLTAEGRYHCESTVCEDLPYAKGDLSYLLAYEYTEGFLAWQLGLDTAPNVKGVKQPVDPNVRVPPPDTDYILTPQLNLLAKDRGFTGGVGIRSSYIRDTEGGDEWTSLYYQFQLGLRIPVYKAISLVGDVFYAFEDWGKMTDFRFGDLEYGAGLNYQF